MEGSKWRQLYLNNNFFKKEYYLVIKKKEILPFAMDLESIMLSEISQAVKDKYHMISPLTGI